MPSFNDIPTWYITVAVVISFYQAYRGYMFQWVFAKERKKSESTENIKNGNTQVKWTRIQKIVLLCIADMFTYLVTTLTGFLSLFLAYYILT